MEFLIRRYKWIFVIGVGLIIIILAADEVEFITEFLTVIYFSVLFYWGVKAIISLIRLKKEKTQTELMHLKSQVNPHFFFNMLNNLYGLVKKDTDKAQELILKLSDMMRYSIYEGQKNFVTLKEEVEYLKNYIELHKMRYHKHIDVQFNLQIENEESKVMPLLFIILLENAFKHGVENLREGAYVHINLLTKGNEINFALENNFDTTAQTNKEGIGLKNLRRRLEIVYPNKHFLTFSVKDDMYKAYLTIKLS